MKNLFFHYMAIAIPAIILYLSQVLFVGDAIVFSILLIFWSLVYIPILNGRRLYVKGARPRLTYVWHLKRAEFIELYCKA